MKATPSRACHHVYHHDIDDPSLVYGESYDHPYYDIDISLDVVNINNADQCPPPDPNHPMLPKELWMKLSPEARRTWNQLDNQAKRLIIGKHTTGPTKPPDGSHHINVHDIHHLMDCLSEEPPDTQPSPNVDMVKAYLHDWYVGSPPIVDPPKDDNNDIDDNDDDEAADILAHVTKQSKNKSKKHPPGNVKRLLSPSQNTNNKSTSIETPDSVMVHGVKYIRQINTVITGYNLSAFNTKHSKSSLIDRGANGGIAGADVRVIETTSHSVDVQGIDNHRMTNIPIVTAGGVVHTHNKGDVIVILNQYAHADNSKTIHSCIQMEAYKQVVHDKSLKAGGKQCIETLDGYVIPLRITDGLPYMNIQPFTDKEWSDLPHVIPLLASKGLDVHVW